MKTTGVLRDFTLLCRECGKCQPRPKNAPLDLLICDDCFKNMLVKQITDQIPEDTVSAEAGAPA